MEERGATTQTWIKNVLREFRLNKAEIQPSNLNEFRAQIERTDLVERLQSVSKAVNMEAGRLLLYEEEYLPPHDTLRVYTFQVKNMEYHMKLTVRKDGPTLVFSSHKLGNRNNYGLSLYTPSLQGEVSKHQLQFNPAIISNSEIQGWFTYLLSEFRHSYKPSAKEWPSPKIQSALRQVGID